MRQRLYFNHINAELTCGDFQKKIGSYYKSTLMCRYKTFSSHQPCRL